MNDNRKILNISLTILFAVALFFLIITFSIGLPIYCRFFYYLHIDALNIPSYTGYSAEEIRTAYDAVLNYLTLPNRPFSTGVFNHSADGMAHFADVKRLVTLNVVIMGVSSVIVVAILLLCKFRVAKLVRPKGLFVGFYSAISIFVVIAVLGILISINVDKAFIVFHHIFFPGQDNWMFDIFDDAIIRILPQEFFINCAILIGASILVLSITIIVLSIVMKKKRDNNIDEQNK